MEHIQEYLFLLDNEIIWATLLIAFICYGLLIDLCFFSSDNDNWYERTQFWVPSLRHMLAALPLLGLLGTITGLLTTFTNMSINKGIALQEVISGGIGDAMFTTQVGLLTVIPGLLLLAFLNFKRKGWIIRKAHEIIH